MTINNISLDDEIPYYEPGEWKSYHETLCKLYFISKKICEFRKNICEYDGKSLYEIYNSNNDQDQIVYRIVMNGFTGDYEKPFNEKSLSRFYYEIYGFGIDEKDAKQLITEWSVKPYKQQLDAMKTIKIRCIKNTNNLLISDIESIRIYLKPYCEIRNYELDEKYIKETKDEYKNITSEIKDVKQGGKLLELFLNISRNILPHYSKLSFFIMSLHHNIKLYLEEYYSKLFYDDNIKNLVSEYIELKEEEIVPGINGISIGYSKRYIIDTILKIFSIFSYDSLKKYFNGIRNELETYIVESWRTLAGLDYNSMLIDFLNRINKKRTIYKIELEKYRYGEWIGALPVPSDFNVVRIDVELKNLSINELINLFNIVQPLMMYDLAYYDKTSEKLYLYLLVHKDIIPAILHEHGECSAKGDY